MMLDQKSNNIYRSYDNFLFNLEIELEFNLKVELEQELSEVNYGN